jgi:hypothetical protein
VALHDVHARDHDLARCAVDFLDLATLAAVAAGDDHDLVALADAQIAGHLEDLRRERDDLHEVALAQLARDRAEDARAPRLVLWE